MNTNQLYEFIERLVYDTKQLREAAARKITHGQYGLTATLDSLRDQEALLATIIIAHIGTLRMGLVVDDPKPTDNPTDKPCQSTENEDG